MKLKDKLKERLKLGESIFSIVMMLFSLYSFYLCGTLKNQNAAEFPRVVGVLLLVTSIAMFIMVLAGCYDPKEGFQARKEAKKEGKNRRNMKAVVQFSVAFVAFGFLYKPLGYILATMLLMFATELILGYRNWKNMILLNVIGPVTLFVVFRLLFYIPLPYGVLGVFFQ